MSGPFNTQVSASTPFNNATNGFVSTEAQSAIEEAKTTVEGKIRFAASCGFDGNASVGRYLEYQSNIDSDMAGFVVPRPSILSELSISVATSTTVTFTVYKWNGTAETLLTTISLSSARTNVRTGLNISVTTLDELRVKCTSGSAARPILFQFFQVV